MGVGRIVEVVDAEPVLHLGHARLKNADGALLLVDLVVAHAVLATAQPRKDLGELAIPHAVLVSRPADDQRSPGLVDQDRVNLVDDREMMSALYALLQAPGHIVPEVVEAELII